MGLLRKSKKEINENELYALVLRQITDASKLEQFIDELVGLLPIVEDDAQEIAKSLPLILADNVPGKSAVIIRDRLTQRGVSCELVNDAAEKKKIGIVVEFDEEFDIDSNLQLVLENEKKHGLSASGHDTQFFRKQKKRDREIDSASLRKTQIVHMPPSPEPTPAPAPAPSEPVPAPEPVAPPKPVAAAPDPELLAKLEQAQKQLEILDKEKTELEEKLETAGKQSGGEVEKLNSRIGELEKQLSQALQELANAKQAATGDDGNVKADLDEALERIKELSSQVKKKKAKGGTQQLNQAKAECKKLSEKTELLEKQLKEAKAALTPEGKKNKLSEDDFLLRKLQVEENFFVRTQELDKENVMLRNKSKSADEDLTQLRSREKDLERESRRLESKVDELTKKLSGIEAENEAKIAAAQKQAQKDIDAAAVKAKADQVGLESTIKALEGKLENQKQELDKAHKDELDKLNADHSAELAQAKAQTQKVESEKNVELAARDSKINELEMKFEGSMKVISEHKETIAKHEKTIAGLSSDLSAARAENVDLTSQLKAAETKFAMEEEKLGKEISMLKTDGEMKQKRIDGLSSDLADTRKQLADKIAELDAERKNYAQLEDDLKITAARLESEKQAECTRLENEKAAACAKLEAELEATRSQLERELEGTRIKAISDISDAINSNQVDVYNQTKLVEKRIKEVRLMRDGLDTESKKLQGQIDELESQTDQLLKNLDEVDNIAGISSLLREHQKQELSTGIENNRRLMVQKNALMDVLNRWLHALDAENNVNEKTLSSCTDRSGVLESALAVAKGQPVKVEKVEVKVQQPPEKTQPEQEKSEPKPKPQETKQQKRGKMRLTRTGDASPKETTEESAALQTPASASAAKGGGAGRWKRKFDRFSKLGAALKDTAVKTVKENGKKKDVKKAASQPTAAPAAPAGKPSSEIEKYKERLTSYSKSQLQDILSHINPDKFPDKCQAVKAELESRE